MGRPQVDAKLAELDGTRFRERLGVNTMIAVSMVSGSPYVFLCRLGRGGATVACAICVLQAVCRAGARAARLPLYRHIAMLAGCVVACARGRCVYWKCILGNGCATARSYEDVVMPVPMITVLCGGPHSASPLPAQVLSPGRRGVRSLAQLGRCNRR